MTVIKKLFYIYFYPFPPFEFQVVKEDMERTLRNTNMKPLNHAAYLRLQVLCQSFWDVEEKLCLLNDLSLADLRAFVPDLLSQVDNQIFIFGYNIISPSK